MSSIDCCCSYSVNWDQPIQLQDCFIPDLDMILPETETSFFESQPLTQLLHQPLFPQQAPSQTLFEHNHLDPFFDQYLPSQETFLPNPKLQTFNETHNLDTFIHTPNQQKLIDSSYSCITNNNFETPLPNFFDPFGDINFSPEAISFPEFRVPDYSLPFNIGRGGIDQEDTKKPTLSSQSIAARQRRRRIAEKTHELGKLIPGGQKLNTADMFHAAAKYVKFLQTQAGILKHMETTMKV